MVLERQGYANYTWAFRGSVEIGPPMLAKIATKTGLTVIEALSDKFSPLLEPVYGKLVEAQLARETPVE